MSFRSFALLGLLLLGASASAQEEFVAGRDYVVLDPAIPTADPARVEVVEVFAYGCIHCATLQPFVSQWKQKLPEDVDFSYMPLGFGGVAESFARAYYAAESLGLNERGAHDALFNAIHVERREFRSAQDVAAFYTEYGVSAADFEKAMRSFAVNTRIGRSKQVLPRYGVQGTPEIVVNGKYRVGLVGGNPDRMLRLVDHLIAKEQAALKAG